MDTCEHYKHEIDRITLNLIPEEQDDLAKSITSIQDEAKKLNIYDSSIVVIDSHINYNKRVWCELLEHGVLRMLYRLLSDLEADHAQQII